MFRALLRLVLVLIIVAAAVAFFLGYRFGGGHVIAPTPVTGTSGHTGQESGQGGRGAIDTERARERGAAIGEKAAEAGNRASEALSDAALTTKIKSKMALDDTIKALDVHVSTSDGNVTLSGRVHSQQERQRAVALAKETKGVKSVTDRLEIR